MPKGYPNRPKTLRPENETPSLTKNEPTETDERKEEIRKLKEELKARNPEGGKVSKADALAYQKQKQDFEKMQAGFQAFCGVSLTVINEAFPKMLPSVFTPVDVSESEKEIIGNAFSVYMERHAESFVENAPGWMLTGSLAMFFAPRLKMLQPKGTNEPQSISDHGKDGDGEEPIDPTTPKII